MLRASLALAAALAISGACGADTATQESEPAAPQQTVAEPHERNAVSSAATAVVPENPADRSIRRALTLVIAQDPQLKDREISFLVSNGDVSVTGAVRNEDERRKINDLAMAIDGVKSVANGLRVEE